jgi:hypothetical protein
MTSFPRNSLLFIFALLTILLLSPDAVAGQYVYGISDDNSIHQVGLTAYFDAVVFQTGFSGVTNGVAWDEAGDRLFYRNPDNGSLYFWTRATNSQQVFYGEQLTAFNANAAFYNGAYWYVEDGSDTLVRASFDFGTPNVPFIAHVDRFTNFDGTSKNSFGFGDIAIDKSGVLYGSSNYGLFSVNISGSQPTQFTIVSPGFGVRQLAFDVTKTFLYTHDHNTGNWYTATLDGTETPVNKAPYVQFATIPLRDISDAIADKNVVIASEIPEPAAWQLLLAGTVCMVFARLRRKNS